MSGMIGSAIFEDLQRKIDEDIAVRDALKEIVQTLEKQGKTFTTKPRQFFANRISDRTTQAILSKSHSTATPNLQPVLQSAQQSIREEIQTIQQLAQTASKHPYYKFNGAWSRQVQDACYSILLTEWLRANAAGEEKQLLTIEEVGAVIKVPVNLKDRDEFHLTIEEYLQALISVIDELARLARNSVTLGDHRRPLRIAQFIKDIHSGFQLLNLKNDTLRRRSDGIKYRVKEVEDVVYDLSLRGLLPKD